MTRARTFDLDDQAQHQDYIEHTAMQIALYGALYQTFNEHIVTVHDARDVQILTSERPR